MNLDHIYKELSSKRDLKPECQGTIRGTCQEYCPYFEYIERTIRGDINKYEKDVLVKKYYRSSAGRTKAFHILSFCFNDFSLDLYKFVENRTRAIRLDISIQELECDTTISILEKICRFHILYNLALYDVKEFESHLNLEQCKKILSTLYDLYLKRNSVLMSQNEVEFISYYILMTFDEKFLFLEKYSNELKIKECFYIKRCYKQNNISEFFRLARKMDFFSYCIIHSYFDKVRLRGMEIYAKCFVEKIEESFFNKILWTNECELKSLCEKINLKFNDNKIDFKNKDLFENENILIKTRKELIYLTHPSIMIYFGDIDYKIFKIIRDLFIRRKIQPFFSSKNPEIINLEKPKKIKFAIFSSESETLKDIYNVILKIYCKAISTIFLSDLHKKIIIFEKKKNLSRKICYCILDLYIKKILNKHIYKKEISNLDTKSLAVIVDDSIFSAIFINNVKKSNLSKYNPEFLKFKEISVNLLLKYRVSVFSVGKSYLQDTQNKYKMLNSIIDTPQNLNKKIEDIGNLINNCNRVVKNKLNNLLDNKSRLKQITIVTNLIKNNRNSKNLQDYISKIDKRERIDNIDVFYEENSKLY